MTLNNIYSYSFLHARLRTATLRHDADGQATLLNLLLRNYLHYNLYDQAEKLVSKSVFPELANNNEWARYLYYTGKQCFSLYSIMTFEKGREDDAALVHPQSFWLIFWTHLSRISSWYGLCSTMIVVVMCRGGITYT